MVQLPEHGVGSQEVCDQPQDLLRWTRSFLSFSVPSWETGIVTSMSSCFPHQALMTNHKGLYKRKGL